MEKTAPTAAECQALYETTRRLSLYVTDMTQTCWVSEDCKRVMFDWLESFPRAWWDAFYHDEHDDKPTVETTP